jgi:hypothetical protein
VRYIAPLTHIVAATTHFLYLGTSYRHRLACPGEPGPLAYPAVRPKLFAIIAVSALALTLMIWMALRSASTADSAKNTKLANAATKPSVPASTAATTLDAMVPDAELDLPPAADTPPYPVDLTWLRTRLPDSRYWELAAPTADPVVAKARAESAKRSNADYGRILAGEASEKEIRDYYEEKRQISQDYLELAEVVLKEKGEELPERDRGLFELTANLHRARLIQIQRDLADALSRPREGAAENR